MNQQRDAPSPLEDLVDMQALWLLHEEGLSYTRQEKFALALKRYHQIFNVSIFLFASCQFTDSLGFDIRSSRKLKKISMTSILIV